MTLLIDDARRMVPRWRPSAVTVEQGELRPVPVSVDVNVADGESLLDETVHAWQENRQLGYAADLVSTAFVLGLTEATAAVRDAAEFILSSENGAADLPIARIAARFVSNPNAEQGHVRVDGIQARLRTRRRMARRYPHDALLWVDIARDHAALGQKEAAEREMKVALGLAGKHRFILRSFTRLALHLGRKNDMELPKEALSRLRRHPALREDPWLLAAEIAAAMVLGETPRSVKAARSLLASKRFSAFELSELGGALGSLEFVSGNARQGKKLMRAALQEPTDNVVAQAAWTARHMDATLIGQRELDRALTFEARAWEHYRAQNWEQAIAEARHWSEDEPFAARPAHLSTFIASVVLADFSATREIAQAGLQVNPDDLILRNNLAFALASEGKASAASFVLGKVRVSEASEEIRAAYLATSGLILFRQGFVEEGRKRYLEAADFSRRAGQRENEALALTYLAREEIIAGTSYAAEALVRCASAVLKRQSAPLKVALRTVLSGAPTMPEALRIMQRVNPRTAL